MKDEIFSERGRTSSDSALEKVLIFDIFFLVTGVKSSVLEIFGVFDELGQNRDVLELLNLN